VGDTDKILKKTDRGGRSPVFYDNGTDTGTFTGYMPHATI